MNRTGKRQSGLIAFLLVGTIVLLAACGDTATPSPLPPPSPTLPASPVAGTPTAHPAGPHTGSIPAPAKLVQAGTLTVGSDTSYAPQEFVTAGGQITGIDIDIAGELANRMGLQLHVVSYKFDDLLSALNAGQFDLVVSAVGITPPRQDVADFVPYFQAGQELLVPKGNPKGIKTLENLAGKTVALEQGTLQEQTIRDLNVRLQQARQPSVVVASYGTYTEAVEQLRTGKVDALLDYFPVTTYSVAQNPATYEVAIPSFDSTAEGIAVAKGNKAMYDAVNQGVTAMKADGSLTAILGKWGIK